MLLSDYNQLKKIPNLCFGLTELRHLFPGTQDSLFGKLKRAIKKEEIIRIRRGLYCLGKSLQDKTPHPFMLAEWIYGPTAISLESALSYHGLIPEAVRVITAVSPHRSNYFKTPLGDFSYKKTPLKNFMESISRISDGSTTFFMASPWRAITDFVYCYKKDWPSTRPLVESLRIELEDLPILGEDEANNLMDYYKNKRVSLFLIKILREQK